MERFKYPKTYFIKLFVPLLFLSLFTIYFFSISLLEARSSTIQNISQTSTTSDTVGEQKTLVALFNYADDQSEPVTLEEVKNWTISSTRSLDNFVKENSYNKAWLNPKFIDWRTLPSDSAEYDGKWDGKADADAIKILDDELDLPDYDRLIFLFLPINGKGPAVGGSVYIESSSDGNFWMPAVWLTAYRELPASHLFKHEFGHTFGFKHATSYKAENEIGIPQDLIDLAYQGVTFSYNEYGDDDNMGGGTNNGRHYGKTWLAGLSLRKLLRLRNRVSMCLAR